MADRVGQQLGNYRLLRLLGEGGFAEVYLGEHLALNTPAAIKVLHTRLAPQDQQSFLSEAQTIARLWHPHILGVLDVGVEGDVPYLVMDYAPGGTLRERTPKGAQLSLATILPAVRQIADALHYAHDQRLIHRNVKPEHLLLDKHQQVMLSDFGIAAIMQQSSRYQQTEGAAGTAAYMAPEQLLGRPCPASDQYSLGIVIYEWLTGTPPFQGSFAEIASQHLCEAPPPLREKLPAISPAVEQVVLWALAKDPKERFASMREFATAFEQASKGVMPVAPASVLAPGGAGSGADGAAADAQQRSGKESAQPASPAEPAQTQIQQSGPKTPLPNSAGPARRPVAPPEAKPSWKQLSMQVRLTWKQLSWKRRLLAGLLALILVLTLWLAGLVGLGIIGKGAPGSLGARATPRPPPGTVKEFSLPVPHSYPLAITAGPDGNVWFTLVGAKPIGRITPGGGMTLFAVPTANYNHFGITVGPDRNLWFTDSSGKIGRITARGSVTEFALPTAGASPWDITAGPDGNLWFTEFAGNQIGRITPGGKITEFPVPTANSLPTLITAGPDGNLWFTEFAGNQIGRITPGGKVTEFPVPTANSHPGDITAGPDGNVWFTERDDNVIGRITPGGSVTEFMAPTAQSDPFGIITGPDGNLWFTEHAGNQIGRITPGGKVTEFPVPTTNSGLALITEGPGGILWFTEFNGNKIGWISPGP